MCVFNNLVFLRVCVAYVCVHKRVNGPFLLLLLLLFLFGPGNDGNIYADAI